MADDYWAPAFQLMLEEARRSIDRQSDRVQHVRERAVGLVGFGSIVAAALGLGGRQALGIAGMIGLGAFVLVAAAALFVLYPREFKFELSAQRMHSWLDLDETKQLGVNYLLYTTAVRHDQHHHYNHQKLKRLQAAIALGVLALAVQTLALIVRLVL
jgi:hypothetical protein